MKRSFVTLALLAAISAAPLAAQGIGLGVGTLVPQGDLANGAKSGLAAIASIEIGSKIGFRAEALWANSDLKGAIIKSADNVPLPDGADVSGTVRFVGGIGSIVVHLGTGALRPYILAGAGYYNRSVAQESSDAAEEFRKLSLKESKVGMHAGVGLKIKVSAFSIFGEVRYHRVNTDDEKTNFVPILVGLRIG